MLHYTPDKLFSQLCNRDKALVKKLLPVLAHIVTEKERELIL